MKKRSYYGVATYTIAGFSLGIAMILLGALFNYNNGFKGPWFHIFDYSADFVIIVFSPIYLSILFCFIGSRREQLVLFNRQIIFNLSQEQAIKAAADNQIKILAKIIGQVNEAIVISDANGVIEWVNDGFINTHGYQLEEVKGKVLPELLHGSLTDKNLANRLIGKLKKGEAVLEELLTHHKNGHTVWLSVSIKPIFDNFGKISNFIAIQNDISNRKEREISIEALYKEIADYKFALDQSAIVGIFNIEGKIVHVNNNFCKINELEEDKIVGKDYRSISISMRDKAIAKPIWDTLNTGETWKGELVNRNINGKTYWTDTTIVPILDIDGKPYQFLSIQQDITVRKTLENQLVASKKNLQMAMQIAKLGSWSIDADNNLTMSEELRKLYQLPLEGHISVEEVFANIPEADIIVVNEKMNLTRTTFQKMEVEYRYIIKGQVHYMVSNNTAQFNVEGNYIGIFGTVQDITETKLIALALKKSEEEKAVVLNNTQTILCVHEMDGTLIDINTAAEKVSGFTKAEVVGLNLKLIIAPEHCGEFNDYLQKINSNDTVSGKMQIVTKGGAKRVWLYQNTVYANNGNKPYVIASAIDITESVKAQNEIEKQQQLIRQIIDNSPNVIFMLDEKGQVMLANKAFSDYYPYNNAETPFAESLSTGKDDIFLGSNNNLLKMEEGQIIRNEGNLTDPSTGQSSWFTTINKCFTEKNGKKYILCFGMDITSRYLIETDLIEANEMVERSLKVKDEFISNMSHEIRTPLNAVIGFTDLLSETVLNFEQTEYIDIVKNASSSLLALINNILDLSKIESKNIALESAPINISKIITEVIKILEPKAKSKALVIETNFDEALPPKVMGDQLRLTQILFNLIGNAIKFTDKGIINVNCAPTTGIDKQKEYISFSIKDTGIGISADKQTSIFQRFTQANIDTQRLYGGTGLGLNITQSIIELYDGTLTMESELGVGTIFNFTLPFKKYAETATALTNDILNTNAILAINAKHPVHILLAEDNMINALLATKVLTKKGFTLQHVVNGALAVEAVQQQHFDLILMDIQMPVMNGINATMAIRKLNKPVSQIPIIAMTAYSLHGEMENCYNTGMNGYVTKPFKAIDLFSTIIEVIKK